MKLSEGWFRICAFASVLWVTGVLAFFFYEFWTVHPICGLRPFTSEGVSCARVLWRYDSDMSAMGVPLYPKPAFLIVPRMELIAFLLAVVPTFIFAIAHGLAWVGRGFQRKA